MRDNKNIRLDKFLADMGAGTRSEVKSYIKKGQVLVNDVSVKDPGYKISDNDSVICKNQEITYVHYEYYMLNKPAGVVTATSDNRDKTVMDLLTTVRKDLFPVGRLDKDTEGLLLITNDGELAHNLLAPKKHVSKEYYVELEKDIQNDVVEIFKCGIELKDGTMVKPAELTITGSNKCLLTIYEGKYHQVKRMFEAVGNKVAYLKRMSMGPLRLDASLDTGEYRLLNEEEINLLRRVSNE